MTDHAAYRKLNDGSHSSSTYHKKDGTPVRAILKNDLRKELRNTDEANALTLAWTLPMGEAIADAMEKDSMRAAAEAREGTPLGIDTRGQQESDALCPWR